MPAAGSIGASKAILVGKPYITVAQILCTRPNMLYLRQNDYMARFVLKSLLRQVWFLINLKLASGCVNSHSREIALF